MTRPGARVLVRGRRLADPTCLPSWRWKCSECSSISSFWFRSNGAHNKARAHARTCTALHLARFREQVGAALVEIEAKRAACRQATRETGSPTGFWVSSGYNQSARILARLTGVPFPADAAVSG